MVYANANIRDAAMMFVYIMMVIGGLLFMGIALWATHYRTGLMEKLGAVLAPLGLLITLLGVLLLCVPDFFFPS